MSFSIFMLWFYLRYKVFLLSHITYDSHHNVCLRGSVSSSEGHLTAFAPQCLVCSWAQQRRSVDQSLFSCGRTKVCVRRGFSGKVVNKGIVLIWRKYGACSRCRCSLGSWQSAVFSPHIAVFVVIFVALCLCQRVCRQEVQWVEVC